MNVTVHDAVTGAPIDDAVVAVTQGGSDAGVVDAGSNGGYRATYLADGPATVTVDKPGYTTVTQPVTISGGGCTLGITPVDIVLQPM